MTRKADRRAQALGSLEDAVQALGMWSEETRDRALSRILVEMIGRIDEIGKDIKELVELKSEHE